MLRHGRAVGWTLAPPASWEPPSGPEGGDGRCFPFADEKPEARGQEGSGQCREHWPPGRDVPGSGDTRPRDMRPAPPAQGPAPSPAPGPLVPPQPSRPRPRSLRAGERPSSPTDRHRLQKGGPRPRPLLLPETPQPGPASWRRREEHTHTGGLGQSGPRGRAGVGLHLTAQGISRRDREGAGGARIGTKDAREGQAKGWWGGRAGPGEAGQGRRLGLEAGPGAAARDPEGRPAGLASAALPRRETGLWPEQQPGHSRLCGREWAGVQLPPEHPAPLAPASPRAAPSGRQLGTTPNQ